MNQRLPLSERIAQEASAERELSAALRAYSSVRADCMRGGAGAGRMERLATAGTVVRACETSLGVCRAIDRHTLGELASSGTLGELASAVESVGAIRAYAALRDGTLDAIGGRA